MMVSLLRMTEIHDLDAVLLESLCKAGLGQGDTFMSPPSTRVPANRRSTMRSWFEVERTLLRVASGVGTTQVQSEVQEKHVCWG